MPTARLPADCTRWRVLLFVPNLVDYVRLVLFFAALPFAFSQPTLFTGIYVVAYILDIVDGYAARHFKQESCLGAMLDMVLDRSSSGCLLGLLAGLYLRHGWLYLMLLTLDVSSHFARMDTQLRASRISHKQTSAEHDGWLLHLYYSSRLVLGVLCVAQEAALIALYMLAQQPETVYMFGAVPCPANIQSTLQVVLGLFGCNTDTSCMLSMWHVVFAVSAPFWVLKNVISAIQLYKSMIALIDADVQKRNGKAV